MVPYNIIVGMCFAIPMVFTYHHKIHLSMKSEINDTVNLYCNSLISMFRLLSQNKDSTDVFIHPGTYILNTSYTLQDLHSIRIKSDASNPAIIRCQNNSTDLGTGVAFLRVSDLIIDHLNIEGCGMKHSSTSYLAGKENFISVHSGIFIQNSTNIILSSINISNSTGIGLSIYDTEELVNITKSIFANNPGGGIHIEFTNCTPGQAVCGSHDSHRNGYGYSKYLIDQCIFKGNTATYVNNSYEEYFYNNNFITLGTGGGVSVWFNGQAKNNSFEVISTNFTSNSAMIGGGLHVHSRENAAYNHVKVLWCKFIKNVGYKEGRGLVIGNVIHQTGGVSKFNTYNITNCLFKQNQALIGGGVLGFGSRESENTNPTNHFEIHNSSFIFNKAQFGSAIQINRQYFDSITVGSIFKLVLKNCNFTSNNFDDNSSIGAVAMSGVNILFLGYTHFINNTSTALLVDGATVEFGSDSVTLFQNNSGLYGGAISLIENAKILVYPNSALVFLRNTAVEHGGAIYVELSTPFDYLLSRVCFIRYYSEIILPNKWDTNITFINNKARQRDNSIFASTLQPCVRAYLNGTELFDNKPFYHYPNDSETKISTLPTTFEFSNKSSKICNIVSDEAFDLICNIVPGEIFDIPVILKDELEEKVDSIMLIASCTEPQSPNVLLPYQTTNGTIQIAGEPNEICHLQLQTDTCTDYPISTVIEVNMLNCPPGLFYSDKERQCHCIVSHTHQIPAISGCEITCLQAYYNKFYWIGYKSDDATDINLLFGLCPYHYCYRKNLPPDQLLPRDANRTVLDKYVCGNRRRTGLLCGQCIEGYSVMMNSPTSTCQKCKDIHLGILYLVLSYILPVSILFYVIMSYNIRMTTGVISAYLFFSQIISSHYYFVSLGPNTDASLTISNILTTIYSISNLEFFQHDKFSYCLFSNAGSVDILAFKLLLSFYPVFLVLVYFLLRRFCICNHRCCQNCRLSSKSITHGVSAFLVLCFAKINILAFGILKNTDLSYINGTSYRKVVHLQGDIEYFGEPLYNVYAIGSLFAIVIIITIPTMILVFHPILINIAIHFEWGESKFILLVNKLLLIHKLKPVLDTFQGDYKDKWHFFAGLHFFLYRLIFFCIIVMASTADVNRLYLLVTTYFLVVLLIHVLTMPFKMFINNAAYSLMYLLMIMIVIIKYHFFSTDNSSNELIWIKSLLILLPLISILFHFVWKLSIIFKAYWKKHKSSKGCNSDQVSLVSPFFSYIRNGIQKFTIITIMKLLIFISIMDLISRYIYLSR